MPRLITTLLVLGAFLATASRGFGQTDSGPKKGTKLEGLTAYAATGEQAGKSVDFVAERKGRPTVILFIQAEHWDRPMARFVKGLDQELEKGIDGVEDPTAVAVWLTDDRDKSKEYLPRAQDSIKLTRTTLAVFEGDTSGPAGWDLDAGARLIAVVVRDGTVVSSRGYVSLNETDVPDVVKALRTP